MVTSLVAPPGGARLEPNSGRNEGGGRDGEGQGRGEYHVRRTTLSHRARRYRRPLQCTRCANARFGADLQVPQPVGEHRVLREARQALSDLSQRAHAAGDAHRRSLGVPAPTATRPGISLSTLIPTLSSGSIIGASIAVRTGTIIERHDGTAPTNDSGVDYGPGASGDNSKSPF